MRSLSRRIIELHSCLSSAPIASPDAAEWKRQFLRAGPRGKVVTVKIQISLIVLAGLAGPFHGTTAAGPATDDDSAAHKYYVVRSENDAEEGTNGKIDLTNEDLDLGQLSGFESAAAVGLRFESIRLSRGTKIKRAFLQFTMEGNRRKSKPTKLTLRAELSPDAKAFRDEPKNISSRPMTRTSVTWSPEPWDPQQQPAPRPETPNLAGLIQQVVNQDDWKEGNALVLIITGDGERDALSFDGGGKESGPLLQVVTD